MAQEVAKRARRSAPARTRPEEVAAGAQREEDLVLASLRALAPSVAAITGPDCEVVVHDLRVPESSIIALLNGHVSGRKLGGPLIGGPMNDIALRSLTRREDSDPQTLSYETKTADGRRLRSTTTLYYNANGVPFAAFCLNLDLTAPLAAARWIEQVIGSAAPPASIDANSQAPDFNAVLDQLIQECVSQEPGPPEALDRDARMRVVGELESRGAFLMRGAVVKVANALGVSKFTVYGYLDEIRGG